MHWVWKYLKHVLRHRYFYFHSSAETTSTFRLLRKNCGPQSELRAATSSSSFYSFLLTIFDFVVGSKTWVGKSLFSSE